MGLVIKYVKCLNQMTIIDHLNGLSMLNGCYFQMTTVDHC